MIHFKSYWSNLYSLTVSSIAILHIMLAVDFTAGCYLRPVIFQILFVTLLVLVN